MKIAFAFAIALALVCDFAMVSRSNPLQTTGKAVNQNPGYSKPGPIQGVWQAVEVKTTGPAAQTIKTQANLTIFAATHYSRVSIERPRPILADPAKATADELRATWGPFVGETGTYEIAGNLITLRPVVAKNPAAEGTAIVYSFKFDGDALLVTSVSDRNGAVRFPETIKLIRIE